MRFWPKKKQPTSNDDSSSNSGSSLTWDEQAKTAISQSVMQAPVPAMLRGRLRKELESAAEAAAISAGRSKVTAEDVMNGLLSKMPANMRAKVEKAMKGGPEEIKKLQQKLLKK